MPAQALARRVAEMEEDVSATAWQINAQIADLKRACGDPAAVNYLTRIKVPEPVAGQDPARHAADLDALEKELKCRAREIGGKLGHVAVSLRHEPLITQPREGTILAEFVDAMEAVVCESRLRRGTRVH